MNTIPHFTLCLDSGSGEINFFSTQKKKVKKAFRFSIFRYLVLKSIHPGHIVKRYKLVYNEPINKNLCFVHFLISSDSILKFVPQVFFGTKRSSEL
jgi:hypothetical protein